MYERNDEKFRNKIEIKYIEALKPEAKPTGLNISYCFKDVQNDVDGEKNQVHTRSLHAEENAFLQIAKHGGQGIKHGVLFTTASPCELCAKKAYQIGVSKVIYIDPYLGIATSHILQSGTSSPQLILFRGAVGKSFDRLYQPIMPFKDELDFYYDIPSFKKPTQSEIDRLTLSNSNFQQKIIELEQELSLLKANVITDNNNLVKPI